MSIDYISKQVQRVKTKYAESDPYALCRAMKIAIILTPMGTDRDACKGFYIQQSRKQAIVINDDLPEEIQRIILAHEIGHAVLHRKASEVRAFHDFNLFNETSQYEYEANIFAADFLMTDEDVLELLNEDLSFFGAARLLNVPAELLDFKFRVLKRKGYKVIDPPLNSRSDFLKKV